MGGAPRYSRCLVGGTFDRLHAGHRLLLDAAVKSAEHVEVHITSDGMADKKSVNMQSFETRRDELLVGAVGKQIPRQLFQGKFVERFVVVEYPNHKSNYNQKYRFVFWHFRHYRLGRVVFHPLIYPYCFDKY